VFGGELGRCVDDEEKEKRSRERQRTTPDELRITQRSLVFVAAFFKLSCLSYVIN